ncbi:MAG: hypothetical protein LBN95_13610 [Prevotellaceae bacterium]|jgi:uncharacterized protein (TIGR02145 family)|nr:hypothetical protein [Prevotellaceae bacterium]
MKKFITITIVAVLAIFYAGTANAQMPKIVTTPAEKTTTTQVKKSTPDAVKINGVVWATRNVGSKGIFCDFPYESGLYYTWEDAQNACPAGWRLPTTEEFESLIASGSVWTTQNGVPGRLFGKTPNQIFLPAAGYRYSSGGGLGDAGENGYYWSSTQDYGDVAYYLDFDSGGVGTGYYTSSYGFCVRPVAENSNAQLPKIVTTPAEKPKPVEKPNTTPAQTQTNKPARTCNSESVMINDVCWAKTNLGAISQTDYGNYYTWDEAKNACPAGWRLPTKEEFESLIASGSVLTTQNGVSGRLFGNAPNQIFLPAADELSHDGTLKYAGGTFGYYWSSTQSGNYGAYILYFGGGGAGTGYKDSRGVFTVRPIAE